MKKNILTPVDNNKSEIRAVQKIETDQTSIPVYGEKSVQESSVTSTSETTKTTAETKGIKNEEYDVTKPRRIIIRARIDNGKGS